MSQDPRDPRAVHDPHVDTPPVEGGVPRHHAHAHPPVPPEPSAPPPVTEEAVDENAGMIRRERVVRDESSVHRDAVVHDVAGEQRLALDKTRRAIWLIFGIIEGLIGLRVVLKLIGANPDNAFATFIYNITDLFVAPFVGITGSPTAGAMTLEIPALVAIAVYALLTWALLQITSVIWPLSSRSTSSRSSTYDRY